MIIWTSDNQEIALADGWRLASRDDGRYSIEREDELEVFADDWAAHCHVADNAADIAECFAHCPPRSDEQLDTYAKAIRLNGSKRGGAHD